MTTWRTDPPDRACVCRFRGIRIVRNNQHESIDDLLRLQWVPWGNGGDLVVLRFGKGRKYRLDTFVGEWLPLPDDVTLGGLRNTLLRALDVDRDDYGNTPENRAARAWLSGRRQG